MTKNVGEVTGLGGSDRAILLHIWVKWRKPRSMKGWGSSDPIDSWHGVVTDNSSGRVIELNLSRCFISGRLLGQLGNLTELTTLRLNVNNFEGGIPQRLASLTKLTGLYLNSNKLSGIIPEQLGSLGELTEMHLHNNKLKGSVPKQLGNLTKLKKLYLSKNKLEGRIPAQLGNLSELTELYLSENMMEGLIPEQLGNLAKLTKLVLCGNKFEGAIPGQVGKLPQLTTLRLDDNNMPLLAGSILGTPTTQVTRQEVDAAAGNVLTCEQGGGGDRMVLLHCWEAWGKPSSLSNGGWGSSVPISTWHGVSTDPLSTSRRVVRLMLTMTPLPGTTIPEQLGNLAQLVYLDLFANELEGAIPQQLGNLTQLTSLRLSYNKLSGTIPQQLGNLTQLQSLSLGSNKLSGTIPKQLGNLTQLTHLDLDSNELSGAIPVQLGNLSQLTKLSLSRNKLSGAIPQQLSNLTQLTTLLSLSDNQLSGVIPVQLGNLTQLKSLNLSRNNLSGTIPVQLGNLTQLTELSLDNNKLSGFLPEKLLRVKDRFIDPGNDLLSVFSPRPQPVKGRFAFVKLLIAIGLHYFDIVSDILAAVQYLNDGHEGWFAISISLVVISWFVGIVTLIRSSPNMWLGLGSLGLFHLHPLILMCTSWGSKEDPVLLLIKFDEAVCESAPQLLLQTYVIMVLWGEEVPWLLKVSLAVSFATLSSSSTVALDRKHVDDLLGALDEAAVVVPEEATQPEYDLEEADSSHVVLGGGAGAGGDVALEDVELLVGAAGQQQQQPRQTGGVSQEEEAAGGAVQPAQKTTSSNGGGQESTGLVDTELELASSLCMLPYWLTRALSIMSRALAVVLLGTALRSYALLALPLMLVARGRLLFLSHDTDQKWSRILKFAAFSIIMEGLMPGELYANSTLLVAVESAVFCTVALTSPSIVSPRPFPAWVAEYAAVAVAVTFVLRCLLDAAFLPPAAAVWWRRGGGGVRREDDHETCRFTVVARRWAAFCRGAARLLAPLFQALGC